MGNARSRSTPLPEEVEEEEEGEEDNDKDDEDDDDDDEEGVVVAVHEAANFSLLEQLAQDDRVPYADDPVTIDETDEKAPEEGPPLPPYDVVEDGVHFLQDGHYWIEIAGLPPAEEPVPIPIIASDPETKKKTTRVRFTTAPIRGGQSVFELLPFTASSFIYCAMVARCYRGIVLLYLRQ